VASEQKRVAMTGNEAVANGMRQINPDVVAAYPITPQTDIVQFYSSFVADGLVHTEMVTYDGNVISRARFDVGDVTHSLWIQTSHSDASGQ